MQPTVTHRVTHETPTVSYDTAGSTETARMLRTLLGNLDGMVYRCRDDAEWTMEFVSEGVRRLTGYDAADLLFNKRVSYEQITYPDDRERVRNEIYTGLRTLGRFDCEYRIVHATGEIRWVWERGTGIYDAHGKLQAIEGLIQDITARKASSQALREAERRYYNLFENAIEGIFRTTIDGQYLDANPALARIYGFDSPAELIAQLKDIRNQLYVEPSRREEFMALAKARGSVSGFESQVYRKTGEVIWISENARAVFDETGHVACYEGHRRRCHRAQGLSGAHRTASEFRRAHRARQSRVAPRPVATSDSLRRRVWHAPGGRVRRPGSFQVHQRRLGPSCRR
jgi:PAS domain S-box-containing protein